MSDVSMLVSGVKKIAILRSGALGDFIVTLPAIESIRLAYPSAELILLGRPWLKSFLESSRTSIDRFIGVPVIKGIYEENGKKEDPGEIEQFFRKMKEEQFDIAIQFQGKGISANPFIKQLEARLTVGMESMESERLDRSIQYYYYQSEPLRYLEIARLIGGKPVNPDPKIKVLEKDLVEAEQFLLKNVQKRFIVLHPFAIDVRRSWPLEKFGEVAQRLYEKDYSIIFSGSKADRKAIDDLIEKLNMPSINSSGQLSLGGLSALMKKSELVISSDTGPLHLARAVGAKTVGIYWAPNLVNWGPLFRERNRPVVSWDMNCPLCNVVPNDPFPFEPVSVTCSHSLSFVKNVKAEEVLREAEMLLKVSVEDEININEVGKQG